MFKTLRAGYPDNVNPIFDIAKTWLTVALAVIDTAAPDRYRDIEGICNDS